ncbi:quinate repressor [Saccharata proteae CBS 121410]|uniref:Quinate repressor n=1 Tax=Saccharata proteae CBS 121410 TaxID=1314787 RepID=A0A9P4HQT0_9PEZI|nr:quinate repressor [Saccharata proteae CBS 121410]
MASEGPTIALSPLTSHPHPKGATAERSADDVQPPFWSEAAGSRPSSAPPTPAPAHRILNMPRVFHPDASIVLVGIRGTGKSTLAVIASVAFQRRVVDTEQVFKETTGQCSAGYRKAHGPTEHHRRQLAVLSNVLGTYQKGCVIVCGTSTMERSGQALLQEYTNTHPVIHIVRDFKSVQEYLRIWDEEKVAELVRISSTIFRGCSNYEFYNSTERAIEHASDSANQKVVRSREPVPPQRTSGPFLTLKRAERHFLKFVTLITAHGVFPSLEPAYPLSHMPPEARSFTYAVSAPLSAILSKSLDVEELEIGADAFELTVDCFSKQPSSAEQSTMFDMIGRAFSSLRRNTIVPLIYHADLGTSTQAGFDQIAYMEILRHGLRFAPEFATLDLDLDDSAISQIIRMKGSTKIIGHYASTVDRVTSWSEEHWMERYEKARKLGCDLVRFSRPAQDFEDPFSTRRLKNRIAALAGDHLPVIAYTTGRRGRTSACFNEILTPVTHPAVTDVSTGSFILPKHLPGITAKEATQALYASFVRDPMHLFIIGADNEYSLSPVMHTAAYGACGLPHTFQIHQTPSLNNIRTLLDDPQFGGSAVTLPYKVEMIALTHSLSRHAKAIGAINTLIPVRRLRADGSMPEEIDLIRERCRAGPVKALYGENTDWIGMRACIRRGLSPANAVGPRTSGLVIGAGGMARAAVYAMIQLGVRNILVYNRTFENAEKLVAHFTRLLSGGGTNSPPPFSSSHTTKLSILSSRADAWPREIRQPTIIVSCIPSYAIADNPAADFTLPPQWFRSPTGGVLVDLGYKNLNTPLLQQVRGESHRGWVAMDGLDLLPEQGFAQFELFTGRRAPRRLMRAEVLRWYRDEGGGSDPSVQARLDVINEREP